MNVSDYVTVSYFSGILAILNQVVSYHLIFKTNTFLRVPSFAYFIEGQKITLGKKACAVETQANPLAIGFFVIRVHNAKVYIR